MRNIFDVIRKNTGRKVYIKLVMLLKMHYIMGKKTGGKYNKIYSECFWMAKTMAYMFYSNKQDKIYLYFPNILNNLKLHKR